MGHRFERESNISRGSTEEEEEEEAAGVGLAALAISLVQVPLAGKNSSDRCAHVSLETASSVPA